MSERTVQSLHAKQTEIGTESERRNYGKKTQHFLAITHTHNFILSCQKRNKKTKREGKKNRLTLTFSAETNSRI